MRKDQVQALIEHAKADFENIEKQYIKALEETKIPSALQIDIKNYMENLRSALDYIAHDIYEKLIAPYRATTGQADIKQIFFPYGQIENDFKSRIGSNLPELKAVSQDLYDTIEAIQPYKIGDSWLYDFCKTLNGEKHNSLTPQIKEEERGLNIDFGGGASISMGPGSTISGTGFIGTDTGHVNLQGETISGDYPSLQTSGVVKQTIIRWVYFKFDDTNIIVLPLLKKAFDGIKDLSYKVYQKI